MKNFISSTLFFFTILIATSCGDNVSQFVHPDLSITDKQTIIEASNQFKSVIRQTETINFIKAFAQQNNTTLMNYLSPSLKSDQIETASKLVDLFFSSKSNAKATGEINLSTIEQSPAVTQLIKSLMNEIRSTTISYKSESQSVELLISNLKSVITNFKVKAQSNSSLTTDEAKVLMLFAEFQYNSISETVSLVLSFDSTSSSGRTEGWFSSLISKIASVIVSTVVAAVTLATIAAPFFGAPGIVIGAIVGGAYGLIYGTVQAVKGKCAIDADRANFTGAFIKWDYCSE
jgi:hypothetical protein